MFDIGFSELLLVLVIGLVVLGPERLPVAVRTVSGWIRARAALAGGLGAARTVSGAEAAGAAGQPEKAEQAGLQNLTPELKASMDELKDAAESLKRTYRGEKEELANTIHNPQVTDPEALHDGVTPAEAATSASAPAAVPKPAAEPEAVAAASPAAPVAVQPAKAPVETAPAPVEPVADKTPASHQPSGDR